MNDGKARIHDIEPEIMECWSICNDLETIWTQICDGESVPTRDQLTNTLLGMQQLYQWKFEKLFNTYESVVKTQHEQFEGYVYDSR